MALALRVGQDGGAGLKRRAGGMARALRGGRRRVARALRWKGGYYVLKDRRGVELRVAIFMIS